MLSINEITKGASVSFKYWAFISYSHRDKEIAKLLHSKLEKSVIQIGLLKYPELGIPNDCSNFPDEMNFLQALLLGRA